MSRCRSIRLQRAPAANERQTVNDSTSQLRYSAASASGFQEIHKWAFSYLNRAESIHDLLTKAGA